MSIVSRHAQERAAERVGRDLTREEWIAAVLLITSRRAALLTIDRRKQTEVYLVILGAMPLRLVWSPVSASVVTVLPLHNSPPAGEHPRTPKFKHGRGEYRRQWRHGDEA